MVSVLLLVAWFGSGKYTVVWRRGEGISGAIYYGGIDIESGRFRGDPSTALAAFELPQSYHLRWTREWRTRGNEWSLFLPLWYFVGPLLMATFYAAELDTVSRRSPRTSPPRPARTESGKG